MAEGGKRRRSRPSNWWEVQDNEDGNENGIENGIGQVDGRSQIPAHSQSQSQSQSQNQCQSQRSNTNTNIIGVGNTKEARPWIPTGTGIPSEKEKKRSGRPSLASGSTTAKQNGGNDNNIEREAEAEVSKAKTEMKGRRNNTHTRRGILSGSRHNDIIEMETVTAVSSLAPKKRGRPAVGVVTHAGQNAANEAPVTARPNAKGTRRAKAGDTIDKENEVLSSTNNQEKRTKDKTRDRIEPEKGESSRSKRHDQAGSKSSALGRTMKKAVQNIEEASEKHSKPKKRVRISDVPQVVEPDPGQSKVKKSQPSDSSESTRKRKDSNPDDQQSQPQNKRRRMHDLEDDRTQTEQSNPPSYRHIAAVTRRVSHETINTKWEPLPSGCLDKISELLIDVQRPVVLQIHDERKKTQASTAIQMIGRRLLNRIRKGMSFPKGTRTNREDDFDFEKILDYNRVLEAQLTPVLHSNDLLESELRTEEILLENEEKYLAELEANAKDEATSRRQAARKAHTLLQFEVDSTQKEINDNIGIDEDAVTSSITLNTSKYQDLEGIVKSINGHVDSIKGNLQQIEGISEAMAKSKASVQAALFGHLDLEQYNDVILGSDAMEQNGPNNGQDAKPPASSAAAGANKSPKKRRKVNHVRPCARCTKRGIGHLCHDEPREPESTTKKAAAKSQQHHHNNNATAGTAEELGGTPPDLKLQNPLDDSLNNSFVTAEQQQQQQQLQQGQDQVQENELSLGAPAISRGVPLQLVQPTPVSGIQANALNSSSNNQFLGYPNDWLGSQNQFSDMHNYHPSYMFNAPEVTNEYNLLNDFLNNSLLDDGALGTEDTSNFYTDQAGSMLSGGNSNTLTSGAQQASGSGPPAGLNPAGSSISRPASVIPIDKAREYYLQAADPTGNDVPEVRMQLLLRAKYDAGMLKPFNYVKGYARLSAYMDGHMQPASKQKILRQLDRFRPKFREKVQALTDIELIYVEMWFERSLMEYDRVFASMAIPACCWRRTGEIFRGNKEMAELIHVPVEKLRDGKIALHEILTEESLVKYWEKFGAIAFEVGQKALLTSCSLKNPDDKKEGRRKKKKREDENENCEGGTMAEDTTRAGVARQLHGQALRGEGERLNGMRHADAHGNGDGANAINVKDKRLRGLLGEFDVLVFYFSRFQVREYLWKRCKFPSFLSAFSSNELLFRYAVFTHTLENDLNCLDASFSRDVFNFAFTTIDGNGTFKELKNNIATFPTKLSASARNKAQELDEKAANIWNLGSRLKRSLPGENDEEGGDEAAIYYKAWEKRNELRSVLVMVRMFAFLVLDCANECGNAGGYLHLGSGKDKDNEKGEKARGNMLRLMKVGIKTVRDCFNEEKIDYAVKVLEKLAGYSEGLLHTYETSGTPEEKATCARFTAEYFVLRTILAWRQDDMQLAEHMFNKTVSSKHFFDHDTTESLSDTLYDMGRALLMKKQHTLAVKWLERAYDVLSSDELDKLSADATELRISIIETLIKALLETKTAESIQRAQDLVDLLESELGDKLIVLLLKLELLTEISNETFDGSAYSAILNKMTRTLVMNPRNLRLFMFHVRKLHDKAPSLACGVLDEMIRLRVKELAVMKEWLEKAILTRIWMTVSGRDTEELFIAVEGFLTVIAENVENSISVEPTMAAHTLIWKKIEATYGLQQYEAAEKWCRLAMHKLFEKPGEANMAKISRKLLLCALGRGDINSAHEVFGSMSDMAKEEPLTRFLMYKIAIRSQEVELAAECLEKIASCSEDSTLLFACVLDAKKAGNKNNVLEALWLVLDKYEYGTQENLHLPSIIRTIIILLISVIESEESPATDHKEGIGRLCKLFEGALNAAQKSPNREIWTILELEWFSRNSYNLSLKNLSIWEPQQTLRMLACCIGFIDHYPQDIGEDAHDDVTLRKMFCNFCAATIFVSIARAEQNTEEQLQFYLNLRKHVTSFNHLLQEKLEKLEKDITDDLLQKLSVLLAFDFEAACRLKDWDSLGEIILKAGVCKSMKVYELMADCILSCETPMQVLVMTLKKIVNRTWEMEEFDMIKLSKYMRCLFQAALGNDDMIAEELVDQVCILAADAAETEIPYPTQELDWLATKSFNHSIDLYSADQDVACKRWAEKSIGIAGYCKDGGSLGRLLRERFGG
ncbi:hypothetical protein SBOR_6737 [Sclerotinia borealis F-4128]|uniref:Protein ZIP4 homolog n=1 Tax=Sclerotinia borealis (strain F-4128) TaxID=1432307 RepID=W9CDJ4_SCLBF|nr:hypothetical protein SBOR_6737 [Sclerotinia borealis F-4128]